MLDAPVSGGEIGAIQGTLAIMVGGDEDVYQKCLPILETMGKTVTRVGELGAGNTVKLMNQIIVAVHIIAMSEAFALGKKSGIHLERAYTAIKDGLAGSRVLDTKINNILSSKFQPGFRVELHAKDLRNAIKAGEAVGVRMPFTLPVLDMFEQLINEGHHDKDHSILYQLFS